MTRAADEWNATMLLKGSTTLVADPADPTHLVRCHFPVGTSSEVPRHEALADQALDVPEAVSAELPPPTANLPHESHRESVDETAHETAHETDEGAS